MTWVIWHRQILNTARCVLFAVIGMIQLIPASSRNHLTGGCMTRQPKECVPKKGWKCLRGLDPHANIMKEKYRGRRLNTLVYIVQEPVQYVRRDSVLFGIGWHSMPLWVMHKGLCVRGLGCYTDYSCFCKVTLIFYVSLLPAKKLLWRMEEMWKARQRQ